MGRGLARVLLWCVVVIAWALVIVFGAAVAFGPDLLTRLVGLVIAVLSLAAALGTQRILRRFRPPRPHLAAPVAEPPRPPADLDHGDFSFPGVGLFKDRTALHLDRAGFDALHLGRPRRYSWADVEEFKIVTLSIGGSALYGKVDTLAMKLHSRGRSLGDRIGRWLGGADEVLPAVDMNPHELMEVMERYRQRYSPVVYTGS